MHSAIISAIGSLERPIARRRQRGSLSYPGSDQQFGFRSGGLRQRNVGGEKEGSRLRPSRLHTEDPRATHLRKMSEDLGQSSGQTKWFECRMPSKFVKAEKKLNANVDFYSASTYHTLGIDVDLFTPVFAVSRSADGPPT